MAGRKTEVFESVFDPLEGRDRLTILYLHGGGYAMGSLASYRAYAGRVVLATGARVIVPDYRLSTEAPFPAALEDAEAVYRELLEGGTAPERLFVGGARIARPVEATEQVRASGVEEVVAGELVIEAVHRREAHLETVREGHGDRALRPDPRRDQSGRCYDLARALPRFRGCAGQRGAARDLPEPDGRS